MDPKLRKLVARHCPLTERAFFGRRHVVPQYRRTDYPNLDDANQMDFERCLRFALGENLDTELQRLALANIIAALPYNRPTVFLESELAPALLRTAVLLNLEDSDIHWRWPALRIVLPLGCLGTDHSALAYIDVCRLGPEVVIRPSVQLAKEIDAFAARVSKTLNTHRLERLEFAFAKNAGLIITSALCHESEVAGDQSPAQTTYGRLIDFTTYSNSPVKPNPITHDERALLAGLERLTLNILLLIGSTPIEYEPEILRQPRVKGHHTTAGLLRAVFVGQLCIRAIRRDRPTHKANADFSASSETGARQVARHWKCGHFKRQLFGAGRTKNRVIWIAPYQVKAEQRNNEESETRACETPSQ